MAAKYLKSNASNSQDLLFRFTKKTQPYRFCLENSREILKQTMEKQHRRFN